VPAARYGVAGSGALERTADLSHSDPPRLNWRNVSTRNLRDFIGYEGERMGGAHLPGAARDARMALERVRITPAVPGVTNGYETDPKKARRKVETVWQMAKESGALFSGGVLVSFSSERE
jgi:hypothetical protein